MTLQFFSAMHNICAGLMLEVKAWFVRSFVFRIQRDHAPAQWNYPMEMYVEKKFRQWIAARIWNPEKVFRGCFVTFKVDSLLNTKQRFPEPVYRVPERLGFSETKMGMMSMSVPNVSGKLCRFACWTADPVCWPVHDLPTCWSPGSHVIPNY